MNINIMVGIPGSGKSTFIRNNKTENDIVISSDAVRKELNGDMNVLNNEKEVWQQIYQKFKDAILTIGENEREEWEKKGVRANCGSVWFDATNCKESSINKILEAIAQLKNDDCRMIEFGIVLKVLKDSNNPELCKQRIRSDIKNGTDRSNVPNEVVDRMYENFKNLNLAEYIENVHNRYPWLMNFRIEEA